MQQTIRSLRVILRAFELLGLAVFGVRCTDCYVIGICCNLFVFWGVGEILSPTLFNVRDRTPACGNLVLIRLSSSGALY